MNGVIITPPYVENGWRFETTGYIVSIHLPDIRSYVSLSPYYNLVVSLAMENFNNNTQGQCGKWWIQRADCMPILNVCVCLCGVDFQVMQRKKTL